MFAEFVEIKGKIVVAKRGFNMKINGVNCSGIEKIVINGCLYTRDDEDWWIRENSRCIERLFHSSQEMNKKINSLYSNGWNVWVHGDTINLRKLN